MLDIKTNCEYCTHKNICKEKNIYDLMIDRLRNDDFREFTDHRFISIIISCNFFMSDRLNRRV